MFTHKNAITGNFVRLHGFKQNENILTGETVKCAHYTKDRATPPEMTASGSMTGQGKTEFYIPKYVFERTFVKIK